MDSLLKTIKSLASCGVFSLHIENPEIDETVKQELVISHGFVIHNNDTTISWAKPIAYDGAARVANTIAINVCLQKILQQIVIAAEHGRIQCQIELSSYSDDVLHELAVQLRNRGEFEAEIVADDNAIAVRWYETDNESICNEMFKSALLACESSIMARLGKSLFEKGKRLVFLHFETNIANDVKVMMENKGFSVTEVTCPDTNCKWPDRPLLCITDAEQSSDVA